MLSNQVHVFNIDPEIRLSSTAFEFQRSALFAVFFFHFCLVLRVKTSVLLEQIYYVDPLFLSKVEGRLLFLFSVSFRG